MHWAVFPKTCSLNMKCYQSKKHGWKKRRCSSPWHQVFLLKKMLCLAQKDWMSILESLSMAHCQPEPIFKCTAVCDDYMCYAYLFVDKIQLITVAKPMAHFRAPVCAQRLGSCSTRCHREMLVRYMKKAPIICFHASQKRGTGVLIHCHLLHDCSLLCTVWNTIAALQLHLILHSSREWILGMSELDVKYKYLRFFIHYNVRPNSMKELNYSINILLMFTITLTISHPLEFCIMRKSWRL